MGEILINQLFAGSYLQEGTNIGHEVINLFKDDNDENYLFVTPKGSVNAHDVDRILFVQNIKARETMEVVMKAEGLSETSEDEIRNIYYAGVNIADIFSKNIYHGTTDLISLDIMATYRAKDVRFPRNGTRIVITVDSEFYDDNATIIYLDPEKNKIVGQGMRTYLSKSSYPKVYEKIDRLLADDTMWEESNRTQKMVSEGMQFGTVLSILEIIRKENDEVIMSNLLSYYFKYNHRMFVSFTKDLLGIKDFSMSYDIVRESMSNIDLWIRDKDNVIVIENKIKSGINGKTDDGKNQLNKYYEFTEKKVKEEGISNAYYYIFMPNYGDISIDDDSIWVMYKILYYSDIYDFFYKNAAEYIDDKYFPDFLKALKNQTMTYSELRFSIMKSRFLEKINQR